IDEPHLELAGDDRRRHETAAGDGDDAVPGSLLDQAPGERLGVAMQLLPGDREVLLELAGAHRRLPLADPNAAVGCRLAQAGLAPQRESARRSGRAAG